MLAKARIEMDSNSEKSINFAKQILPMNVGKTVGIILLALVWIWLCWALIARGGGFSGKNVFLVMASGIIIFVPLYKKYFRTPR